MTHCSGGPGAANFGGTGQQITPVRDTLHDVQTALEAWVERGVAPGDLIATKFADDKPTTREIKYQRPLCLYPTVAQYRGTGDANDPASFVCKLPTTRPARSHELAATRAIGRTRRRP